MNSELRAKLDIDPLKEPYKTLTLLLDLDSDLLRGALNIAEDIKDGQNFIEIEFFPVSQDRYVRI